MSRSAASNVTRAGVELSSIRQKTRPRNKVHLQPYAIRVLEQRITGFDADSGSSPNTVEKLIAIARDTDCATRFEGMNTCKHV